jgi:hypothetical protein
MAFTLTIRERNHSWAGRNPAVSTHATVEEARAVLAEYVQSNWESEVGTTPPADPQEMINEYFADVLEQYEIVESTGSPR